MQTDDISIPRADQEIGILERFKGFIDRLSRNYSDAQVNLEYLVTTAHHAGRSEPELIALLDFDILYALARHAHRRSKNSPQVSFSRVASSPESIGQKTALDILSDSKRVAIPPGSRFELQFHAAKQQRALLAKANLLLTAYSRQRFWQDPRAYVNAHPGVGEVLTNEYDWFFEAFDSEYRGFRDLKERLSSTNDLLGYVKDPIAVEKAVVFARKRLDDRRPIFGRSNLNDALNVATLIGIFRGAVDHNSLLLPVLVTQTSALLDEREHLIYHSIFSARQSRPMLIVSPGGYLALVGALKRYSYRAEAALMRVRTFEQDLRSLSKTIYDLMAYSPLTGAEIDAVSQVDRAILASKLYALVSAYREEIAPEILREMENWALEIDDQVRPDAENVAAEGSGGLGFDSLRYRAQSARRYVSDLRRIIGDLEATPAIYVGIADNRVYESVTTSSFSNAGAGTANPTARAARERSCWSFADKETGLRLVEFEVWRGDSWSSSQLRVPVIDGSLHWRDAIVAFASLISEIHLKDPPQQEGTTPALRCELSIACEINYSKVSFSDISALKPFVAQVSASKPLGTANGDVEIVALQTQFGEFAVSMEKTGEGVPLAKTVALNEVPATTKTAALIRYMLENYCRLPLAEPAVDTIIKSIVSKQQISKHEQPD